MGQPYATALERPGGCADVYHVYRGDELVDQDANGVADDYGTVLLPNLIVTVAVDPQFPLDPLFFFYYLVTAENAEGKGSLGNASNGETREDGDSPP